MLWINAGPIPDLPGREPGAVVRTDMPGDYVPDEQISARQRTTSSTLIRRSTTKEVGKGT